jgi:tryptophan-rich sensory protein
MSFSLSLIVFLALVIVTALSGAVFMPGSWYFGLAKPSWTPPSWLFAPVWTILYGMIAVAGWLVWREAGVNAALVAWAAQLAFNGAWSYLMFGRHEIGFAFIDLALMWVAIVAFIVLAWPVSTLASFLFMPYLVWVSLAGALNLAIWRLNP